MDNLREIEFERQVYAQDSVNSVIDRTFREFAQPEAKDTRTVSQFFSDYEYLYYQIPIRGDTESHEYLVKKSSELYSESTLDENIQPLLDEITELKKQSIQYQQTIVNLQIELNQLKATSVKSEINAAG